MVCFGSHVGRRIASCINLTPPASQHPQVMDKFPSPPQGGTLIIALRPLNPSALWPQRTAMVQERGVKRKTYSSATPTGTHAPDRRVNSSAPTYTRSPDQKPHWKLSVVVEFRFSGILVSETWSRKRFLSQEKLVPRTWFQNRPKHLYFCMFSISYRSAAI